MALIAENISSITYAVAIGRVARLPAFVRGAELSGARADW